MNSASGQRRPRRGKYVVALIILIGTLPLLGSYALYLFWRPETFVNYGELIKPVPLAEISLTERDGREFRFADLRGSWVLLTVDAGACDSHCRQKLHYLRQVRLTQGRHQDRIERVWLISDGLRPSVALDEEYGGTRTVILEHPGFLGRLPAAQSPTEHIYIIDPLGNLMMRFPRVIDPGRMKKDLARLVGHSDGWRRIKR